MSTKTTSPRCTSATAQTGVVTATVTPPAGSPITVSQNVTVAAGSTQTVTFTPAGFPKLGQPWATPKLNTDEIAAAYGMIANIDANFARLLKALDDKNLAENTLRDNFRFVENSIADADLAALLDGVTHVFHLAAQAGVRKSWGKDFASYTANNVDTTQRLLEGCVGRPLQRFVHASSSSVYGDRAPIPMREDALPQPVSPYGVTKMAAEHLGHLYHVNYGLPVVALRYFTVYGPRQRPDMGYHKFIDALLRGTPLTVHGDGLQTRGNTYVSDCVAATVASRKWFMTNRGRKPVSVRVSGMLVPASYQRL